MNVRFKLILLFMATLGLLAAAGSYMAVVYQGIIQAEENLLLESNRTIELSYQVDNEFHSQIDAWKNVLLRGNKGTDYHTYLSQFYQNERLCRQLIDELINSVEDKNINSLAQRLNDAHRQMGRLLRKGLQVFNNSQANAGMVADRFVADFDQLPEQLISSILHELNRDRKLKLREWNHYRSEQERLLLAMITTLVLVSLASMLWLVDRNIGRPAERAAYLAGIVDNLQSFARFGTWDWDSGEDKHYWSPGFYQMLGLSTDIQPSSDRFIQLLEPSERKRARQIVEAAIRDRSAFEFEARIDLPTTLPTVFLVRGQVKPKGNDQVRMTSLIYDISEMKAAENKLQQLASYDTLTGLPNRSLFQDRFGHALELAKRKDSKVALIFMDIDQFKSVNDTMGHAAGDALLKQVSEKIRGTLRASDTAARIGGDEFTIILEDVKTLDDVSQAADMLIKATHTHYSLSGEEVFITTSMGITLFPDDGDNSDTLLKNADIAMYSVKELGRNGFQLFTQELNHRSQRRLELECKLRQALDNQEFRLVYQPIIDVRSRQVVATEALLRWHHHDNIISPAEFITPLEETGLIVPVGEWVIEQACEQAMTWQAAGITGLQVSVNLSVRQLRQEAIVERIAQILTMTGLNAERLELEITESTLIDSERILENLKRIEALGVKLSIDDFGTGYSSLSYLKNYSVDRVKIDRSFIMDICVDKNDEAITSAIIGMTQTLGLSVVGEGVETNEQYAFLEQAGCDRIQGFLIAKPMSASEFMAWLEQQYRDNDQGAVFWRS